MWLVERLRGGSDVVCVAPRIKRFSKQPPAATRRYYDEKCPKSEKVAKFYDFHLFCSVFTLCRIEDLRRPELLHQIWRHLEENYDFNLKRRRFDAARDAVCDWSINHDFTSKFKTQWRHGNHVRRNDGMSRGHSENISSNRLMRPLRRKKFEFV